MLSGYTKGNIWRIWHEPSFLYLCTSFVMANGHVTCMYLMNCRFWFDHMLCCLICCPDIQKEIFKEFDTSPVSETSAYFFVMVMYTVLFIMKLRFWFDTKGCTEDTQEEIFFRPCTVFFVMNTCKLSRVQMYLFWK